MNCFEIGTITSEVSFGCLRPNPALDLALFFRYRSGTVNSNTVNSKFHLIRSYCEYLARTLSFHV